MYQLAKNFFNENCNTYQTAELDPAGYNLNAGLVQLANAVESDLDDIQQLLRQIAQSLQQL